MEEDIDLNLKTSMDNINKHFDLTPSKTLNKTSAAIKSPGVESLVKNKSLKDYFKINKTNKLINNPPKSTRISKIDQKFSNFSKKQKIPSKINNSPLKLSECYYVPGSINCQLRDYQKQGIQWLYNRFSQQKGGILGDDMGLGKTLHIVALSAAIQQKGNKDKFACVENITNLTPVLIISPKSLMQQWEEEYHKWGNFKTTILHGTETEHSMQLIKNLCVDVVITNYDSLISSFDFLDENRKWSFVVFDEVQFLRNPKTKASEMSRKLNIKVKFGLSGTVIQNSLDDFWTVMNICCKGVFQDKSRFRKYFSVPIKRGTRYDSESWECFLQSKRMEELKAVTKNAFLRRTKEILGDSLPEKKDFVIFSKMAKTQQIFYKRFLDLPEIELIRNAGHMCKCGSGLLQGGCCNRTVAYPILGESVRAHKSTYPCKSCPRCLILPVLKTLKKIADHLDLLEGSNMDFVGVKSDTLERNKHGKHNSYENCGKLNTLEPLLVRWQGENKKLLLFSHSTKMIRLLSEFAKGKGYIHMILDGSSGVKKRHQIVKDFNSDSEMFILLVSTKAGGVGLNLTAADVVVIFDIDWNPSHDLQAEDRSYRIGRKETVEVYRLISSGTIEEAIYLRQIDKQQLANSLYSPGLTKRYFTEGDLEGVRNLLQFDQSVRSRTESLLNRERKCEYDFGLTNQADFSPNKVGRKERIDDSLKERVLLEETAEEKEVSFTHSNAEIVRPKLEKKEYKREKSVWRKGIESRLDNNVKERKNKGEIIRKKIDFFMKSQWEKSWENKNKGMILIAKKRKKINNKQGRVDYLVNKFL